MPRPPVRAEQLRRLVAVQLGLPRSCWGVFALALAPEVRGVRADHVVARVGPQHPPGVHHRQPVIRGKLIHQPSGRGDNLLHVARRRPVTKPRERPVRLDQHLRVHAIRQPRRRVRQRVHRVRAEGRAHRRERPEDAIHALRRQPRRASRQLGVHSLDVRLRRRDAHLGARPQALGQVERGRHPAQVLRRALLQQRGDQLVGRPSSDPRERPQQVARLLTLEGLDVRRHGVEHRRVERIARDVLHVRRAEHHVRQLLRAEVPQPRRHGAKDGSQAFVARPVAKRPQRPHHVGHRLRLHLSRLRGAPTLRGRRLRGELALEPGGDVVEEIRTRGVVEPRARPRDVGQSLGVHAAEIGADEVHERREGRGGRDGFARGVALGVRGDAVDGGGGVDGVERVAVGVDDCEDIARVASAGELALDARGGGRVGAGAARPAAAAAAAATAFTAATPPSRSARGRRVGDRAKRGRPSRWRRRAVTRPPPEEVRFLVRGGRARGRRRGGRGDAATREHHRRDNPERDGLALHLRPTFGNLRRRRRALR